MGNIIDTIFSPPATRPPKYNGEPPVLRQIPCAIGSYSCNKCDDGGLDPKFHPYLTPSGDLKVDTFKPSLATKLGFPLWWRGMIYFILVNILAEYIQSQGYVPNPFDPTFFSYIGNIALGMYLLNRLQSRRARSAEAARAYEDVGNATVSLAGHISSLLSIQEARRLEAIQVELKDYSAGDCMLGDRNITAAETVCEIGQLLVALPYTVINSARARGVHPDKLPLSQDIIEEIKWHVAETNPDYNSVNALLIQDRFRQMQVAGLFKDTDTGLVGAQYDELNTQFGNIAKIQAIAPGANFNRFVRYGLFIYFSFFVWLFPDTLSRVLRIVLANVVILFYYGALQLVEAENLPFENLETNPYSGIDAQNSKHAISIAAHAQVLRALAKGGIAPSGTAAAIVASAVPDPSVPRLGNPFHSYTPLNP